MAHYRAVLLSLINFPNMGVGARKRGTSGEAITLELLGVPKDVVGSNSTLCLLDAAAAHTHMPSVPFSGFLLRNAARNRPPAYREATWTFSVSEPCPLPPHPRLLGK